MGMREISQVSQSQPGGVSDKKNKGNRKKDSKFTQNLPEMKDMPKRALQLSHPIFAEVILMKQYL